MYDRLYGIYDSKARRVVGLGLSFFPADASACRWFTDVVRAPDTQVGKHPRDYCLVRFGDIGPYELGDIGVVVTALANPVLLLTGSAVVDADADAVPELVGADPSGVDPSQLSIVE